MTTVPDDPAPQVHARPQRPMSPVQVDLRGGALPEPEANGVRDPKIPLDAA